MLKKIIVPILCSLAFLCMSPQTAMAANRVTDIDVDVAIYEDGSAYITQTWSCNFTEGTEGYIPIENLGEMSISDFMVSDVNGAYYYIEDWNVDASFEDKAGKCGIVETDKGYELCWGITEYGERRYAIEYKINDLVGSYQDYDGFNFQLINSKMGTLPTDVTVNIIMQNGIKLDANNAGIWAFGFDGQINFEDGNVIAYTENPLSSDLDSVIIMLQLNKGMINPTRAVDGTFDEVKTKALEGSDYDQETESGSSSFAKTQEDIELGFFDYIVTFFLCISCMIPVVIIIYLIKQKGNRKKKIGKLYSSVEYYREAPLAGNLEATFVLAKNYGQTNDDGNLIGAAFLKLINTGCLEPMSEKKVGLFGKEKESISLRLVHSPQFTGITANMLYDLLVLVSGVDQILQESELEEYCRRNHAGLIKIIDSAKQDGKNTLDQIGCHDSLKSTKSIGLTQRGEKLLLNIMGLKKFLLEFSLINEKTIAESIIWQDYLTFATLLGIADKAIEQFERVYPEVTQSSQNAHYYYMLSHRYTRASYEVAQAARFEGSGGSSSYGGGGGFSGGGSGGGTR